LLREPTSSVALPAPAIEHPTVPTSAVSVDTLYQSSFVLKNLTLDPIQVIAMPVTKATSLSAPSYIDPAYGTRIYRVTAPQDFPDATAVRHDYSRRQAFNANNTRFVAGSSNGYWLLYDANTFKVLKRTGNHGALKGLVGDCEIIWHPTDPKKLWYTGINGGLVWWEKNVETDTETVMADFRGRLPWPKATGAWTKSEGTSSADGRYFAFMATSYDEASKKNVIYGLFSYDRVNDKILGTLDASKFDGAYPDHISISPSGKYAVPSWAHDRKRGTRAYPLDFSSNIQLLAMSEHSDLAMGADGQDYYVGADYDSGNIRAVNMATGKFFDLMRLYPRSGSAYAVHVSGKAYGRPGWVVISTYGDSAEHGKVSPDPKQESMYKKIILAELKPNGRLLGVAHTRIIKNNYGGYSGEHQATVSRDGSRILFASNFDSGGPPSDFMVVLPSWVYK
jgi:hypothetical protein